MKPHLVPASPLSQVVFVHNYLQLVFEDECFNIYNRVSLHAQGTDMKQGTAGFADGLVQLIGSRMVGCETEPALKLRFESGAELTVLMGDADVTGPEAFQYTGGGGVYVVKQNAV